MKSISKLVVPLVILATALAMNTRAERHDRDRGENHGNHDRDENHGNRDQGENHSDRDRERESESSVSVIPPWTDPAYDNKGNPASTPDTPVYSDESGLCDHKYAIMAPNNGGPVTLKQWRAVTGTAEAECTHWGTRVNIKLHNLLPNGVYTIWLQGFKSPGLTTDFANLVGVGALGLPDGSQNAFKASATGDAELSVLQPAAPYSDLTVVPGSMIPKCLFDLGGFQLLGAYHPDGQTHGPHPAASPCEFSIQFAFNFPPDRRVVRGTGAPVTLFLRTRDAHNNLVPLPADAPDSALLWESRFSLAVTNPAGHQFTWGEFKTAQARAAARCVRDGTRVVMHMSGLVPDSTYTVWTLVFNGPFPAGPNPSNPLSKMGPFPFGNLVGVGSLGPNDGSGNTFHTAADGTGELTANVPPGLLSTSPPWLTWRYNVVGCLLNEVEFHLVGVYHFDDKSYGPSPGFAHGGVEQFGIQMKQ